MPYDFRAIEPRWQAYWDEHHTFRAEIDPERPKYYVLDMFPYPSGDGLHVGHPEGYTATDIVARYKRMRGFNVLHPMGWDAFGLPAERYAMKTGTHPAARTAECIVNFKRQLKTLGFSYDWEREIDTTDPRYYKWTQWIFLQIWNAWYDHEAGRARPIAELDVPASVVREGAAAIRRYRDERRLAYLHEAPVNWCPELRVVLANEEVAEHVEQGYTVVRRPMRQWMLRITAYAERLLTDLEGLEWSQSVMDMQRHWIGRSEGAEVEFRLAGDGGPLADPDAALTVFTTRPDTLFGATYMVLAPEHPQVARITTAAQRAAVDEYVDRTARRSERDRQADAAEGQKTGVFTGAYAINPANGARVPVWISDYVLMAYGTGAIMAVPGHDERDHAFATAMNLPIVEVVAGGGRPIAEAPFVEPGTAVRSGFLDGLPTADAKARMIAWLEQHGLGRRRVTYKLRDWLFSRQRYWGEPFPLIHRPNGEVVAADLPVTLPDLDDFQPSESGEPPLSKAEAWRNLPDGSLRETNTMPQWAGSCWYYLRFMDPRNTSTPFSRAAADYWLPVDLYVGGAEHAVLHLLYARFWHKILFDLGYLGTREPFQKLVNQGMVLGATFWPKDRRRAPDGKPVLFRPEEVEEISDGVWRVKASEEPVDVQWDKMSKSRGNVVNPDDVIRLYGADTMRLYEMFMGPLEHSAPWQTEGVAGCHRFLQRAHRLAFETGEDGVERLRELPPGEGSDRQRRLLHRTLHAVRERIDRLAFNTAISAMMVFVRDIVGEGEPLHRDALAQFTLVLSPFAPHLAEEIWRALGNPRSLAHELWPAADEAMLLDETWPLVVQVQGKRRAELPIPQGASEADITARVLADADVQRHLAGKAPRRVIYVPGKLINLVV